jgi:hypothetical protein
MSSSCCFKAPSLGVCRAGRKLCFSFAFSLSVIYRDLGGGGGRTGVSDGMRGNSDDESCDDVTFDFSWLVVGSGGV